MDEMGENVILRVNEYRIFKNNIQVIEINNEKFDTYEQFVNDRSDFDICKNYFSYSDGLFIGNLYDIISRSTKFNYTHDKKKSTDRCVKYQNRGIEFTNLTLSDKNHIDNY